MTDAVDGLPIAVVDQIVRQREEIERLRAERDALRIVVGDCQMMLLRLLSFVNKTENIARYDIPALLQRIDAAMAKGGKHDAA